MKSKPIVVILILVIASLLVISLLLILTPSLVFPELVEAIGDRIALAQYFIEIASLSALLFAAFEFIQSTRRPQLALWMEPLPNDKLIGIPTKISGVCRIENVNEQGTQYAFEFKLLLENSGTALARFVKISAEIDEKCSPSKNSSVVEIALRPIELTNKWKKVDASRLYIFHGGDDWVAYAHPKLKISELRPWLANTASFELSVRVRPEEEQQVRPSLRCTVPLCANMGETTLPGRLV